MIAKQPSQVVIPHCVMPRLRPCAALALAARQAAPCYPAAAPDVLRAVRGSTRNVCRPRDANLAQMALKAEARHGHRAC